MAVAFWLLFSALLLSADATDSKDNPADELVAVVNANRTAHKSHSLVDSPGLGCIALQYIKAYQGKCDEVGNGKKPADTEFAETFAPNCGVQASTLGPITGRLLGCQSKYVPPSEAFSDVLIQNSRSLEILYSKNHTQVGAGVSGSDGGAPYFWCVMFAGGAPNKTFALEGGVAKITRPGCFSGTDDDCSDAGRSGNRPRWVEAVGVFVAVVCALGL
ncbi:hypothetical protein H6P81_002594 [Aristolochia fimbriata]|uniref:Ferredoxin-like protein n=1 Tax=Aristolochia fimbriata TaxID=158543 RepID=A0AAV7FE17_ARIFI|nr:hypothetical protein H6P81_002594 [Aristolochia fimbriata]